MPKILKISAIRETFVDEWVAAEVLKVGIEIWMRRQPGWHGWVHTCIKKRNTNYGILCRGCYYLWPSAR
jgi:hypothetical protein